MKGVIGSAGVVAWRELVLGVEFGADGRMVHVGSGIVGTIARIKRDLVRVNFFGALPVRGRRLLGRVEDAVRGRLGRAVAENLESVRRKGRRDG